MIEENTNRFADAFAQADAAFDAQYPEVETTRDNKVLVRDVQLVEKELSWWQRTVQISGYAAMLILLVFIVIKSLKWAKILRK